MNRTSPIPVPAMSARSTSSTVAALCRTTQGRRLWWWCLAEISLRWGGGPSNRGAECSRRSMNSSLEASSRGTSAVRRVLRSALRG